MKSVKTKVAVLALGGAIAGGRVGGAGVWCSRPEWQRHELSWRGALVSVDVRYGPRTASPRVRRVREGCPGRRRPPLPFVGTRPPAAWAIHQPSGVSEAL
jgi:hypothetical protein